MGYDSNAAYHYCSVLKTGVPVLKTSMIAFYLYGPYYYDELYIIILHKIVHNCCMTKIISDNELFSEGHYLKGMHIVCAELFDMYYVCMYVCSLTHYEHTDTQIQQS